MAEGSAGTLTLEGIAEDVGSNISTVNASIDGPDQQVKFNVKYLADVLAVIDAPEVDIRLASETRPGVIRPASGGAGNYLYLIMPMSTTR